MRRDQRQSRRFCLVFCSTSRSMRFALQNAARRQHRRDRAGAAHVDARTRVADFAGFMLTARRIKRLFAYSSIEHMGIITFAFGMGGPLANFAGLLHMTMHSLTKSAIFSPSANRPGQGDAEDRQYSRADREPSRAGLGACVGVMAIAGMPPFGVFMSEFLVVSSTFARLPLLAIPLAFGLLVAFGALLMRVVELAFGEPSEFNWRGRSFHRPTLLPSGAGAAGGTLARASRGGVVQNVAGLLG